MQISPIQASQLAGEEDAGGVGRNDWCAEWEIDSTVLRPEPRLDRFDGARGLTGIGADALVLVHQTRCATHEPDCMFRIGSDASARVDTGVGVNAWVASQGLFCEPLVILGPARAVAGFILAVATVRKGPVQGSAAGASASVVIEKRDHMWASQR